MNRPDASRNIHTAGYRWIVWSVLILSYLVVFFHRLALGVVREDLTLTFGISATTFGNLGATYFYAYTLMQIPSGVLADSLGARKTVTYGTLLAAAGSVIFGMAPTIRWAFAGRLLVGIGVSVVLIATLKTLSQWFPEDQFATMSGLTAFMGNIGGMMAQTPLALLLIWFTWRTTFVGIGIASFLIALLCYGFVRNSPQDIGLPPATQNAGEKISQQAAHKKRSSLRKDLITTIRNPYTWPSFFVFMGVFGSYITMTGSWGNSYLKEVYGLTATAAANLLTLVILGHALGCMVIGRLSDRMKRRRRPMLLFVFLHLLAWAALLFWNGGMPPAGMLPYLFFIMGLGSASVILGWSCSKEVNHPSIAGIATSIVNMGGFVGAAALPVLLGVMIDRHATRLAPHILYQRAFLFCFAAVTISLVFAFMVKETRCQSIYGKKET